MGGALTGSNCSYEASLFSNNDGGPPNVGQSIIAFDPAFYSDGYLAHLETAFAEMTRDNDVRIPGDRRNELRRKHEAGGVEVPEELLEKIAGLSEV